MPHMHAFTHAQEIAKARAMRFTFLSGDVHVAGLGQFESTQRDEDHKHDFRFMNQVGGRMNTRRGEEEVEEVEGECMKVRRAMSCVSCGVGRN
jgi:hypothetical protein